MHQIKIFKGLENELPELEAAVNEWLRSTAARIVNIFGNIAPQSGGGEGKQHGLTRSEFPPSDVMLIVVYEQRPQ
jgi:hypothetical protein